MSKLPPEPGRWEDMPGKDIIKKKMDFRLMKRGVMSWSLLHSLSARASRAHKNSKPAQA